VKYHAADKHDISSSLFILTRPTNPVLGLKWWML